MATAEKTIQGLSDKLYSKLIWKNNNPRYFQLVGTGTLDKFNHNVSEGIPGLEIRRGGTFPASTNIYDPFETGADKMKVVRNITGRIRKQKDGAEAFYEDVVAPVVFGKDGQLAVQPGEKHLLARLLFSDDNASNTYRRTNTPPLWEEVKDHTLEKQERIRMEEFKDMARQMVKRYTVEEVKTRLQEFNPKYSFNGKQVDDLRYDLRQYAEADPRYFISNAPDEAVRLGLIVDDALAFGILQHNHDAKFYAMDGKSFFTYEIQDAENPQAALIKHLMSKKGKEDKDRLVALLKED